MEKKEILSVEHLTKQYVKGVSAVDDISFSLTEGEVFGLLGPNGSGKTTTILMLLGLLEPTSGAVSVLGCDPFRKPLSVKRQVAYMPDDIGFYDTMSAYGNVDYTARFLGLDADERKKRIEEAFDAVRLTDRMHDKARTFSHGMKRRLGLAEILVKQPKIAILDEPTQGLDPQSTSEFLQMIRTLKEQKGMTFLISSHQLDEVQSVCDRVGLFSQGKLIGYGSLDELSRRYFGPDKLVEVQVDGDKDLLPVFSAIQGVQKVERKDASHWVLQCATDLRAKVSQAVFASGENLMSLSLLYHSLGDIYQHAFEEVSHEEQGT
jgi:ABC-2 type transport system ATP-binding protein